MFVAAIKLRALAVMLATATSTWATMTTVHAQDLTAADVCDDCKARELTVGSEGDFETLTAAFCAFFAGDVIRIQGTLEISEPQVIDGADEDLCEGGARGVDDTVLIAGQNYAPGTGKVPAISRIVIGGDATALQGQAALKVQNARVVIAGVSIEASTLGVIVGSGADVSFMDATIRSGAQPNETMLLVTDGGKLLVDGDPADDDHPAGQVSSYGLTFEGQTKVALRVAEASVTLEDVHFGTALSTSTLHSEYNLVAEQARITFNSGLLDFGGFSKAALSAQGSEIDGWDLYLHIPNDHFDDRNGEELARGPRPAHSIVLRDVMFEKGDFTFGNLYAPALLSGVTAQELTLEFDECSKSWAAYDSLLYIENVSAEKLDVRYNLDTLCRSKSTIPYILSGTNEVADIECGGIFDSIYEGCEGSVWGRYRK